MKLKNVIKILNSGYTIEFRFLDSLTLDNEIVSNRTKYVKKYGECEVIDIRMHNDSYGTNFLLVLDNKKNK